MLDRLRFALDVLGLRPFPDRLREIRLVLAGDDTTPPSRFGLSSLRILDPKLALPIWFGRRPYGRRVPIYNLFNRSPTPEAAGWSVRKTQVRDFRGGTLSYDSHNGTDFATPPGTTVVAAAPGRVAVIVSEYNRGGLKLMLDHGDGLITTYAHLTRVLVRVGDVVGRAQPIALSGASGLNFIAGLGADPPHLHMNVWLDGTPIDPFAGPGETSLWRGDDNSPKPAPEPAATPDDAFEPGDFDPAAVDRLIASCRAPAMRAALEAPTEDLALRACRAIFFANYYPTRFPARPMPYTRAHARTPRLDLPFSARDYDGVVLPDAAR